MRVCLCVSVCVDGWLFVFYRDAGTRRAAELERLQEEVNAQEDFIEVVIAATFGFPDVPEDKDNMSIEILAEVHCALRRRVCVPHPRFVLVNTRAVPRNRPGRPHAACLLTASTTLLVCSTSSRANPDASDGRVRQYGHDPGVQGRAASLSPALIRAAFMFALCIVRF
jgi:hypothetical protein